MHWNIIIKELSLYLLDVLIVNSIIILSFAVRFELDVNLTKIYSESATFTYSTLFLTPTFLRFYYYPSTRHITSLMSLIRSLTFCSIVIILLVFIIAPTFGFPIFKHKSLFIISWVLNIMILPIVRLWWFRTLPDSFLISQNNRIFGESFSRVHLLLRAFRPDTRDLRSLLIGVMSSIVAFLILYHLFGYK